MRVPDWKERLYAAIDAAREREAQFGVHDCLQFPAFCIEAITGVNPAAQFGEYRTEEGAAKLMAQFGGVSGILTHAFGEPVAPNQARVGDAVTLTFDGLETGGVCNGTTIVFCAKPRGLGFLSREMIQKAWLID
jgi:hypothetical protein